MIYYESPFHATHPKHLADKMCKAVDDNPDLDYEFVEAAILAIEEVEKGETKPYVRRG